MAQTGQHKQKPPTLAEKGAFELSVTVGDHKGDHSFYCSNNGLLEGPPH